MSRRARPLLLALVLSLLVLGGLAFFGAGGSDDDSKAVSTEGSSETSSTTASTSTSTTTTTTPIPSSAGTMSLTKTVTGDISPKSVVASGRGQVFAQNMMYRHTVTVYDRDGNLTKTIPDTVNLADFGIAGHPGLVKGAPVEVAFTPDGKSAYVSNYSMYGEGFGPEGDDDCPAQNNYDNSFLYRIDTTSLDINGVIAVGKVPKYVAVSPDGKYVLATNWCSYDLSVVDAYANHEVKRIPIGPYPRGIAISPDSKTAYIAVMGTHDIARVDLTTFAVSYIRNVGGGPRHLVLSPDGASLYVTLNAEGKVAKVDPVSGVVQYKVSTGNQPRSMAISTDGQSLYVVNYESSDVSKLAASDLHLIQTVQTGYHPIGITYDRTTGAVWVANYRREHPDLQLLLTFRGRGQGGAGACRSSWSGERVGDHQSRGGCVETESRSATPAPPFCCVVTTVGEGHVEACLQGELDLANSPLLRDELLAVIDAGLDAITLRLGDLTFVDSSGIVVLVIVRKHALEHGTEFHVTSVQPHVRRLLESSGVAEMFDLEPTT